MLTFCIILLIITIIEFDSASEDKNGAQQSKSKHHFPDLFRCIRSGSRRKTESQQGATATMSAPPAAPNGRTSPLPPGVRIGAAHMQPQPQQPQRRSSSRRGARRSNSSSRRGRRLGPASGPPNAGPPIQSPMPMKPPGTIRTDTLQNMELATAEARRNQQPPTKFVDQRQVNVTVPNRIVSSKATVVNAGPDGGYYGDPYEPNMAAKRYSWEGPPVSPISPPSAAAEFPAGFRPAADHGPGNCGGHSNGALIRNYEDCQRFFQCDNGRLHAQSCAPSTFFEPNLRVCVHTYQVADCDPVTRRVRTPY